MHDLQMPLFVNPDVIGLRRSGRTPKPKKIFTLASFYTVTETFTIQQNSEHNSKSFNPNCVIDGTINYLNPVSQVFASQTDDKTYTYKDMLKQEDYWDFIKAMTVKINDHTKQNIGNFISAPIVISQRRF